MSTPLSYSIEQAAERLGPSFTEDWLRHRVKRRLIPFGKTGAGRGRSGHIYFTDAHLAEILLQHEVRPDGAPEPTEQDFTPVTRRRSS